jgi:hypothetical protein
MPFAWVLRDVNEGGLVGMSGVLAVASTVFGGHVGAVQKARAPTNGTGRSSCCDKCLQPTACR